MVTSPAAASIACAVLRGGDEARLATTDGRGTPVLADRSDIAEALEFLALLAGGHARIDLHVPFESDVVVAISPLPELVFDETARRQLATRLKASLVITCGRGDESSPPLGSAGAHDWIHLASPAQLPQQWRMPLPAGHPAENRR